MPAKKSKPAGFWRRLLDSDDIRASLSAEALKRRKDVMAQKATVTARISESTRTIGFGVLASCYALLIADEKVSAAFGPVRAWLLLGALSALLAIITDALQYVFGYINTRQALSRPDQGYPTNWSRDGRQVCFLLKQLFAYLAGLLLVIAIIIVLF